MFVLSSVYFVQLTAEQFERFKLSAPKLRCSKQLCQIRILGSKELYYLNFVTCTNFKINTICIYLVIGNLFNKLVQLPISFVSPCMFTVQCKLQRVSNKTNDAEEEHTQLGQSIFNVAFKNCRNIFLGRALCGTSVLLTDRKRTPQILRAKL